MAKADPKEITQRFRELKDQRSSWEPLWRDIRDYCLPDMGCFSGEDASDGHKRYGRILDPEAIDCADILAAGLLSGVSSPSRPWLKLTTLDEELDRVPAVAEWLDKVQRRMLTIFSKAEIYNQLHQSYLELVAFGSACTMILPHPEQIVHLQNLTIGQYWLADDPFGRVDTVYRKLSMTAKQMVQQWGLENVSSQVRNDYERNPYAKHDIIHVVEPRLERNPDKIDNMNLPWRSVYFEENQSDRILSESGFRDFPALCPRWMTIGGSVYGRGPGAKALSASKALQQMAYRFATLIDYYTDMPVAYPDTFTNALRHMRPGGRIPINAGANELASLRPAWEVKNDPQSVLTAIQARRADIQRMYYVNVFQMIAANQNSDRTATEVAALEQEKVMMMGPVLERLHSELLDPLVSNTFNFMVEQNALPEVPDDLNGKNLSVEYISVLAEAQRNSSVTGIVRWAQQIGMLTQLNPNAVDRIDIDKTIEELADINGIPPSLVVSGDKAALIREARDQQQQAQMQAAQMPMTASALKDLSQAADGGGLEKIAGGIAPQP